MAEEKEIRGDTSAARGEAAEESAAVQATHWHSRMETEEPARVDAPARLEEGGATPSRVRAQPPEEFTGGEFEGASETSGGLAAVWSSLKHAAREMGLLRGARTLRKVNQKDGFDCPGCAWPDPDGERSHAEFCENGAKAVAEEATVRRVTPDFFREWGVADLSRKSDYWLGKRGRITQPLILRRGATHYEPIGWDEAFALVAGELNTLASPDEAAFYTSGRTSNEAAFLYQLFVRQFGTNNLPDCSNMCHESSSVGLNESIGLGKASVRLSDFK